MASIMVGIVYNYGIHPPSIPLYILLIHLRLVVSVWVLLNGKLDFGLLF